ncbi:hypothetical protein Hanom_Chr09g00846161 [Helianthus anomalus]
MLIIFQAVVLVTRLTFLYVQMLQSNQLKAKRTCSITSFGMKTRRGGTQKIKMIELPLTYHQHHKDLKN